MLDNALAGGKNMFDGEGKSQIRAREALPILVKRAQARKTISYTKLAEKLGLYSKTDPINMGKVCASISATLHDLEECWEEKIPRIASIVTRLRGELSPWMCEQLTGNPKKQPTMEQFASELEPIFNYTRWDEVLEELNLSTVEKPSLRLMESAVRRGKTAESDLHKRLKDYVAHNPESVGLNKSLAPGQQEVLLPSGDKPDVLFQNKQYCIAVEVKSHISDKTDLMRGIFQCVKYRKVLKARRTLEGKSYKVKALLAIEMPLPKELICTKKKLRVKIIEDVCVKDNS